MTEPELTPAEITAHREELCAALMADDPAAGLWSFVDRGRADVIVPEIPALRLEQDPIHRHKDVLAHSIAVTAKTPHDLRLRLAALFHDVGKPATRKYERGTVTFHHHEAVGAKMTRRRLRLLCFDEEMVKPVTELVRLSGRFKGYADGWSDAAVRRYARTAGPLLGDLNELVRCDCTTRNRAKAEHLREQVDELEVRIGELAAEDRRLAERPAIDGNRVMDILGIPPGPKIGQAVSWLLAEKRAGRANTTDEAERALKDWWEHQIS